MKILTLLGILGLFVGGCAGIRGGSFVGPARASFDSESLTRAQKIVYGSHYVDFYATLDVDSFGQTCFLIRIETDDSRLSDALMWNVYSKRDSSTPTRVSFRSYAFEPHEQYPLIYKARACSDDVWDRSVPLHLHAALQNRQGIDPIQLEWSI